MEGLAGICQPDLHVVAGWLVTPAGPWACHMRRQSWVSFSPEGRMGGSVMCELHPRSVLAPAVVKFKSAIGAMHLPAAQPVRGSRVRRAFHPTESQPRAPHVVWLGWPKQAMHDQDIQAEEQECPVCLPPMMIPRSSLLPT